MFENMVLRRIFGPRRDEVTGEWRRLHNEELSHPLPCVGKGHLMTVVVVSRSGQ